MKYLKQYFIPVNDLKQEDYCFEFNIDNKFFEQFENSEIKRGDVFVNITLTKNSQNIILDFDIRGTVNVMCDRCLDYFDLPIKCNEKLYFVFGEKNNEQGGDLVTLKVDENEINVAQYIYEFITLSLPIKKTHPDDENGESTCNKKMLEKLNSVNFKKEKELDPRWEKLKNLIK
ncbi:MAG: DUF177 domain-containing protein [Bacteroidales bacterium]|nr:DUF177 domain-containing protein [Bacteroidales bacterium]